MSDESSISPTIESDQSESELVLALKKVQQQLAFLEKKIDTLISQSQARPMGHRVSSERPYGRKPFAKPQRSFDRPRVHGKGERERRPEDRGAGQGRFYDRFEQGKKHSTHPKRKPFVSRKED